MSSTISVPDFTTAAAAPLSALVLAHTDQEILVDSILGSHGFVVAYAATAWQRKSYAPCGRSGIKFNQPDPEEQKGSKIGLTPCSLVRCNLYRIANYVVTPPFSSSPPNAFSWRY
jgi:hypothetical protein